ncbi:MAG: alpha amylase C-terminal domain-containing protein, partial [Thiohalocapsa sp.]
LNGLYRGEGALHTQDFDWQGFEWIDCHDAESSVLIYQRRALPGDDDTGDSQRTGDSAADHLVIALNFTPVPREGYRIGMPAAGAYQEVFNSDADDYGGSGLRNGESPIPAEPIEWMGQPQSLVVTLPPLAGIVLRPAPADDPPVASNSTSDAAG